MQTSILLTAYYNDNINTAQPRIVLAICYSSTREITPRKTEDLIIDSNKYVTLQGGYNNDYTADTGKTTLNGNLTISDGTVIIGDFTLQ